MLLGSVIDHDIDLAELVHRLLDSFSTKLLIADIARDQQTFAPVFFHQALGLTRVLVFFEIGDRNVRSLFRKGNRDRATDPAVAAGDKRDLVSQLSAAVMLFILGYRARLHLVFAARLPVLMLGWLTFLVPGHKELSQMMYFLDAVSRNRTGVT